MTHEELLETWFRRVWHEEDMTAIDDLLRPDSKVEGLYDASQPGPEEFKVFAQALLGVLSDITIDIRKVTETGPWAAALIAVSSKCRATGKPVEFSGQVMVRIEEDRIVEGYNHIDFITLYESIGILPEATLGLCLSGQKLRAA